MLIITGYSNCIAVQTWVTSSSYNSKILLRHWCIIVKNLIKWWWWCSTSFELYFEDLIHFCNDWNTNQKQCLQGKGICIKLKLPKVMKYSFRVSEPLGRTVPQEQHRKETQRKKNGTILYIWPKEGQNFPLTHSTPICLSDVIKSLSHTSDVLVPFPQETWVTYIS